MKRNSVLNNRFSYFINVTLCRHPMAAWLLLFIGIPMLLLLIAAVCASGIYALCMLFGLI